MHPARPPKRLTALVQVFLHPGAKRSQAQTKVILSRASFGDSGPMARPRKERPPTASEQLEVLLGYPWPFQGRPPKHDLSTWTVTDDWPEDIPVTEAEVDVFEAWFGDLFDELFGPCR
jgi:hypothetical protein